MTRMERGARGKVDAGGVIGVVEFPTFGGNRWLVLIKEGRFLNRPLRNSGFPKPLTTRLEAATSWEVSGLENRYLFWVGG